MFSTYQYGLTAGGTYVPEVLSAGIERFGQARRGLSAIRSSEPRFYNRGITGLKVGSTGLIDGLTGLILDLAHVLLILAGMYMLWTAIRG